MQGLGARKSGISGEGGFIQLRQDPLTLPPPTRTLHPPHPTAHPRVVLKCVHLCEIWAHGATWRCSRSVCLLCRDLSSQERVKCFVAGKVPTPHTPPRPTPHAPRPTAHTPHTRPQTTDPRCRKRSSLRNNRKLGTRKKIWPQRLNE